MSFLQIYRSRKAVLVQPDVQLALAFLREITIASDATVARQSITTCIEIEEQSLGLQVLADGDITLSGGIVEEYLVIGHECCCIAIKFEVLLLIIPSIALATSPYHILRSIASLVDRQHEFLAL